MSRHWICGLFVVASFAAEATGQMPAGYVPPTNSGGGNPYAGGYTSNPYVASVNGANNAYAPPPGISSQYTTNPYVAQNISNSQPTSYPPSAPNPDLNTSYPQYGYAPNYSTPSYPPPNYAALDESLRLARQNSALPPPASRIVEEVVPTDASLATPIAEEMAADPVWYTPSYWFPTDIWEGGIELGINGSTGNSESFSMKAGGKAKRKTEFSILEMDIAYVKTNTNSVLTQHNAIMNGKVEWPFADSPWSMFAKLYGEYDEFQAYDVRLAFNAGFGYRWFETDISKLTTRLGAGWSREFGGPQDQFVPEAVMGLDYERQISKRQKFSLTSDYFPDWGDFSNYRIVTSASWQLLLDEEHNLSLKVGAIDRYDSTPNGAKPNDVNYSIVLLWEL